MNWNAAVAACDNLVYGGYDDWRLPNIRELYSLIDARYNNPGLCNTAGDARWAEGDPFNNVQLNLYWSRTVSVGVYMNYAWVMDHGNISVFPRPRTDATWYVWPVRGGGN